MVQSGTAQPKTRKRRSAPASPNFTPDRRYASGGPKRASAFTPALTRPAFEKFGFPAAALLTDWAAIAGADIASFSAPERLKWPRRPDDPEAVSGAGATLVLRVDGPRALELQYRLAQLIERINAYFGFRAVAQIRLYQAPLETSASHRPRPERITPRADRKGLVNRIDDPRLRTALSRIAAAIDA